MTASPAFFMRDQVRGRGRLAARERRGLPVTEVLLVAATLLTLVTLVTLVVLGRL